MIPFERVAECIRKLKVLADVESDLQKKYALTELQQGLQLEYNSIVENNIPCPPEMEEAVDKSLRFIEDLYDKKACN